MNARILIPLIALVAGTTFNPAPVRAGIVTPGQNKTSIDDDAGVVAAKKARDEADKEVVAAQARNDKKAYAEALKKKEAASKALSAARKAAEKAAKDAKKNPQQAGGRR